MICSIHNSTGHSVRFICQTLDLPRSSYFHGSKPTQTQLDTAELTKAVKAVFAAHLSRYGVRRVYAALRADGWQCGKDQVRRIMRAEGLRAYQPKTFVPRTSDGRADAPSPNLLEGQAMPTKPNQVWVSDFTYIPCGSGFVYLCVVMDLFSRRMVGWSLANHMRSSLVTEALQNALASRRSTRGLIFHSDRGSQYGSKAFRQMLLSAGLRQSMSARANPYHNAWSESVIGKLKCEMLRDGRFSSIDDARIELTHYIDAYYNTQRIHSSLNYLSPATFEANFAKVA
jgi:transposase InsO family protein